MLRYRDVVHNTVRLRALTTLEPDEFAALVPGCNVCCLDRMRDYTIAGLPRLNRRDTPYKTAPLPTPEDKLLCILVHMKQHLTHEVHGQLCGMTQSDAHTWLHLLRPSLLQTLEQRDVAPARLATLVTAPASATDQTPLFIMLAPNVLSSAP